MNNKSFRPYHLLPVLFVASFLFFVRENKDQPVQRAPTSLPKVKHHRTPGMDRGTKAYRKPASVRPSSRIDFDKLVVAKENINLRHGNIFAENIGAIPLDQWKPGMAPLIFEDGAYGYYQKRPSEKSIPVAYNAFQKSFYPISSVVHLRDIDESTREALKREGFEEYLYFKNIKKLSIRARPEKVVELYETLEKRGHRVSLEVLQHKLKAL